MNEAIDLHSDGDFGDGDDYESHTGAITIEPVDNGWIVYMITDEEESKVVFEITSGKDMMKFLADNLGVNL